MALRGSARAAIARAASSALRRWRRGVVVVALATPMWTGLLISGPTPGVAAALRPAAAVPGPWVLRFDDEFGGGSLNTRYWSPGWLGRGVTAPVSSGESECYDPRDVGVAGGSLVLRLRARTETCGGRTRPYASGLVESSGKYAFTYGFVEARIWLPGGTSISDWPAFWTDGEQWPRDGELDVVEGLGGRACFHFHSDAGGPGSCARGTYARGWHTYGAEWEPGRVTYYYDGRAVGTITAGVTGSPMYLILNLAVGSYGGATKVPATMRVDYVRVFQH